MSGPDACFVLYCRSGYETDLSTECEYHLADKSSYGYTKYEKNSGLIALYTPTPELMPAIDDIVFARQKLRFLQSLTFVDKSDRITPVIDALHHTKKDYYGSVIVEHADNERAKSMAKFCRKFTVPLRSALRNHGILSKKHDDNKKWLHLVFDSFDQCMICESTVGDRSPHSQGINRLKFPTAAPSRSTLKLEEAIALFFDKDSEKAFFNNTKTAVDLGACPGGWTFQLVSRGMKVEAVDNGDIATSLMDTGLVHHFKTDGFVYKPLHGKVNWLVCDMIENPHRVGELIIKWIQEGWANGAIFNLKLPMKNRFATVKDILLTINKRVNPKSNMQIRAKHLYHDRDEITVLIMPK